MIITIKDEGDRSVGIKPLRIEFKVNEYDHREEWQEDFAECLVKYLETWFDFNGKVNVEIDSNK